MNPPVRVRRSFYSTLSDNSDDAAAPETRRRTLSRLIPWDLNPAIAPQPQSRRSSGAEQTPASVSKVHTHITQLSTARQQVRRRRGTLPWPPETEGTESLRPRAYSTSYIPDPEKGTTGEADEDNDLVGEPEVIAPNEHGADIVEHLDVIDPQISTVANLTHTANSIFLPPLLTIKPVVNLPDSSMQLRDNNMSVHEDALDRHVEDVLTRKRKFMRMLSGVWAFVKTPLGFVMAIYGFNIVFWGAGIVFFLGKIINLHNEEQQGYWVELCCQVETGLFTLTSVGLIPWRILDTWRIYWIWYYKRKTAQLRAKKNLPQLTDRNDLPDPVYDNNYVPVLTEEEQKDLHYHQQQFMFSQTWYRPHGTETHTAFPINYALLICILNDGNSIFQIGLCACMWAFNRFERPAATTATLLPAGFLCGIGAAVTIWLGSQKTKRTDKIEDKMRSALSAASPTNFTDAPFSAQPSEFNEASTSNVRLTVPEK